MKKIILWILMISMLFTTGCSFIEQTQGADLGQADDGIISQDTWLSLPDNISDPNQGLSPDTKTDDKSSDLPERSSDGKDSFETDTAGQNLYGKDSSGNGLLDTDSLSDKDSDKKNSTLKVHFIDVGQGDSILIESAGKYMLIDAGENEKGKVVINYLKNTGVKKLDYIIATHPHSDHIGGLDDVVRQFDIGKVIMPDVEHTTNTFDDLLDAISEKGLKITKAKVGNKYDIGDASFVIIAPNSKQYDSLNNYSVSIKLTNGKNSFVFTSDAEVESENEMLRNGIDLKADVLKLGHHGSTTSNSDRFLDAVDPEIAVISVGEDNSYGHPHAEILQSVKDRNITLYRTDKQGTIILESDGKTITANQDPYNISKSELSAKSEGNKSPDKNKNAAAKNNSSSKSDTTDTKKNSKTVKKSDNPKNITVHITKSGSKYHRAGCRHLNKSDIEVTLEEALNKGLTPCKTCNPPTN